MIKIHFGGDKIKIDASSARFLIKDTIINPLYKDTIFSGHPRL